MTDRELLYFKSIAEHKSFSKAAKSLYMAQPTLSQCINNIEKELGTALFVRSTKGLVLTDAGERYYECACRILDLYEDMSQEIGEINGLQRGKIKLGTTSYISALILPQILPEFSAQYPGINISLMEGNSTDVEDMLLTRQLDAAFIHATEEDMRGKLASMEIDTLWKDPFVIILPKGSAAAQHKSKKLSPLGLPYLDPKYLADEKFIMGMPVQRIRQVCDRVNKMAGISPDIVLTTRNYSAMQRLVDAGIGVSIVPWQYAVSFKSDVSADAAYYSIPEEYNAEWTLCIATANQKGISKACRTFIDMCMQRLEYGGAKRNEQ